MNENKLSSFIKNTESTSILVSFIGSPYKILLEDMSGKKVLCRCIVSKESKNLEKK
jgi:hypothetical protein